MGPFTNDFTLLKFTICSLSYLESTIVGLRVRRVGILEIGPNARRADSRHADQLTPTFLSANHNYLCKIKSFT